MSSGGDWELLIRDKFSVEIFKLQVEVCCTRSSDEMLAVVSSFWDLKRHKNTRTDYRNIMIDKTWIFYSAHFSPTPSRYYSGRSDFCIQDSMRANQNALVYLLLMPDSDIYDTIRKQRQRKRSLTLSRSKIKELTSKLKTQSKPFIFPPAQQYTNTLALYWLPLQKCIYNSKTQICSLIWLKQKQKKNETRKTK